LEEARERARKARKQLADGIDPVEAKKAARAAQALEEAKAISFKEAAKQYFDGHERNWRNAKHRAQFLSTLEAYAFPHIGKLPVGAIDTGLVLKVIEPIWSDKTGRPAGSEGEPWRRQPLNMLRTQLEDNKSGTVGGGVQVAFAAPDGFHLSADPQPFRAGQAVGRPLVVISYRGFDLSRLAIRLTFVWIGRKTQARMA